MLVFYRSLLIGNDPKIVLCVDVLLQYMSLSARVCLNSVRGGEKQKETESTGNFLWAEGLCALGTWHLNCRDLDMNTANFTSYLLHSPIAASPDSLQLSTPLLS